EFSSFVVANNAKRPIKASSSCPQGNLEAFMTRRARMTIIGTFGVCALILVLGKSMSAAMNPDENVFLASASLWGNSGLMPYRDFHYNHLPTLLLIYGLMFKVTGHLLLAARLLSTLCATA